MNLPDSFYIALCMTILLVGAVYWVWTQIQYVQRKVNVLENIVYELKTLCSRPPDVGPVAPLASVSYPPAPPSVLGEDEDLLHETLSNEIHASVEEVSDVSDVPYIKPMEPVEPKTPEIPASPTRIVDEPIFDMSRFITRLPVQSQEVDAPIETNHAEGLDMMEVSDIGGNVMEATEIADDLQPGGVGSGVSAPSLQSSLDGMTTKELRRLAQQKGISGANDMKKKDLIAAIRAVPIESFLE